MTSPSKLWENQNVGILRSSNPNPVIPQNNASSRSIPILPPRPNSIGSSNYGYNSYSPYSGNLLFISHHYLLNFFYLRIK